MDRIVEGMEEVVAVGEHERGYVDRGALLVGGAYRTDQDAVQDRRDDLGRQRRAVQQAVQRSGGSRG